MVHGPWSGFLGPRKSDASKSHIRPSAKKSGDLSELTPVVLHDKKNELFGKENVDRRYIDEIIKESYQRKRTKADFQALQEKDGDIKDKVILAMGLHYQTPHIEHFLNADLDWQAVLALVSSDEASYIITHVQGGQCNRKFCLLGRFLAGWKS